MSDVEEIVASGDTQEPSMSQGASSVTESIEMTSPAEFVGKKGLLKKRQSFLLPEEQGTGESLLSRGKLAERTQQTLMDSTAAELMRAMAAEESETLQLPKSTGDLEGSFRDKIRAKFKSVVAKAENEERSKMRLSQLRQKSVKLDSRLDEEDDISQLRVEQALERSFVMRQKMQQQLPLQQVAKQAGPTFQEQYDFFTKIYDQPTLDAKTRFARTSSQRRSKRKPKRTDGKARTAAAPETPVASTGDAPVEPERAEETPGTQDEETELLVDHLQDDDEWVLASIVGAKPTRYRKQMDREAELYFTPTVFPVSVEDKKQADVRRLEEEGLFVGTRPELAERIVNTMEQRLLREKGQDSPWFSSNGELKLAIPPLTPFPSKLESAATNAPVKLDYVKAGTGRRVVGHEQGVFQLDVDVSKLLFTHHPLFSKEQVLTMRLMEQCKCFLQRAQSGSTENSRFRLYGLKEALKTTGEQTGEETGPAQLSQIKRTIIRIHNEIVEQRQLKNMEEALDYRLLKQILATWSQVKTLRQQQRYSTTSVQLYLRKENVNVEDDQKNWESEILEEVNEREALFLATHEDQPDLPNGTSNGSAAPEEVSRQQPSFDRNKVLADVKAAALQLRRQPGEPILTPVFGSSSSVTPIDQCPREEQDRRKDVAKRKIRLSICFNGLEVCKTTSRPLNADFCLTFLQIYNLRIFELPREITVKVFENSGSGFQQLTEVCVPVPLVTQATSPGISQLEELQFSSDLPETCSHAGVGSGASVDLGVEGCSPIIPCTSGVLQCSALWGRASDGVVLAPAAKFQATEELLRPHNAAALKEIRNQFQQNKLDPNDPQNRRLLALIKDMQDFGTEATKKLECFRLEPLELELVPESEFYANPRFRLFELREKDVSEFRRMQMIPAYTRDIPSDIFKAYEQRLAKETERQEVKDIDAYRTYISKYLSTMREQVFQQLHASQLSKSLSDVVYEQQMPNITLFGMMLAEPTRPLKPARLERKRVTAQNLAGVQVKILFNVVRAFNVPVRTIQGEMLAQSARSVDIMKPKDVEPFVEVTFQRHVTRTSVLQGSSPTWNQQLFLDFNAPNDDYSSGSLQTVTDAVTFNLYDNVISQTVQDNRQLDTVQQQIEKRWLGTLRIPFSTIYYNGRVFGSFRLRVPPVLLGYTMATDAEVSNPYLQIFIAIEPPLMPPEPIRGKFESIESESLRNYADRWMTELSTMFPSRRFVPLVIDMNGRTVLTSRYLRPIKPPEEVMKLVSTDPRAAADLATRMVSLIPFVSDPVLFPGMCDIWSSCEQFLSMLCGDEEEHAVLLYCWLEGIGVQSLLLLGNGLPEGPRAAYVLARLPGEPALYNPSTGNAYSLSDPLCPLHSVGCVVTQENLFANIQPVDHPASLNFDLTKIAQWKPFFHKKFPNPGLSSIQVESLNYIEPDKESITQLQERLERAVRDKIMSWRPHNVTRWNRYAIQILRQLLPTLEKEWHSTGHEQQHTQALHELTNSYKMCGFPLNQCYVSAEQVIENVFATNVHNNPSPDVEFALAVYIHAYTNNIMSVWVYVASLVRKR